MERLDTPYSYWFINIWKDRVSTFSRDRDRQTEQIVAFPESIGEEVTRALSYFDGDGMLPPDRYPELQTDLERTIRRLKKPYADY